MQPRPATLRVTSHPFLVLREAAGRSERAQPGRSRSDSEAKRSCFVIRRVERLLLDLARSLECFVGLRHWDDILRAEGCRRRVGCGATNDLRSSRRVSETRVASRPNGLRPYESRITRSEGGLVVCGRVGRVAELGFAFRFGGSRATSTSGSSNNRLTLSRSSGGRRPFGKGEARSIA